MFENIRSLIVIFFFSALGFYILSPFLKNIESHQDVKHWKKLWIGATCLAFLSSNYWVFIFFSFIFIRVLNQPKPEERIADFLILVCCLPALTNKIPGFAGINYLFNISWPMLIVFSLLSPLFLFKPGLTQGQRFLKYSPDIYVISYVVLTGLLAFRDKTFTEAMRPSIYSLFYIFIPYFVLSRYVISINAFKKIISAIFIPVFIMSLISIFEVVKSWHIYDHLRPSLGLRESLITSYKFRAGVLRASTAFGAIHLGYMTSVAMSLGFYLAHGMKINRNVIIIYSFLLVALLGTMSRGPWVGFFVMAAVYALLGRDGITKITKYSLLGLVFLPVLALTESGQKFLDLLPFVGSSQADTVSYRQELFIQSMKVIKRYPWFGSTNYLDTPEMQDLIQGEGIIDIVNTYLQIALENGVVAVSLLIMTFVTVIFNIYKLRPKLKSIGNTELYYLGNSLIATLIGTMVTIATVSSTGQGITAITYWVLIALGTAYIKLVTNILKNYNSTTYDIRVSI